MPPKFFLNAVGFTTLGPAWLMAFVTRDGMGPGSASFNVFVMGVVIWQGIQALLITAQGQSVGKRVFGLRIVLMDGRRAGFVRWTSAGSQH